MTTPFLISMFAKNHCSTVFFWGWKCKCRFFPFQVCILSIVVAGCSLCAHGHLGVNAPDSPHFWHKKSPKGVAFLLKQFESDVIIFLGNPGPTFWWLKRLSDGPNPRQYQKVTTILAGFYLSIFLRVAIIAWHTLKILKTEARSISFGRVFSCRSRRRWQSVLKTSSGRWWCLVQARPPQERIFRQPWIPWIGTSNSRRGSWTAYWIILFRMQTWNFIRLFCKLGSW